MASANIDSPPKKEPLFWSHLLGWFRSIPRTALLSLVGPSLLLLIGYFGWLFYGAPHYEKTFYGLSKENVILTQPEWIRSSVTDEVFKVSGLENVSIIDNEVNAVVARAFDAHPSIRKTQQVQIVAGGRVLVKAEFRQPVAMVHCEGEDGKSSFLPIDKEGVLLPRENFQESDVPRYIWIYASGIKDSDERLEGRKFGDPRIEQAAQICGFLAPYRDHAMIRRLHVYSSTQPKKGWMFELITAAGPDKAGPRIKWGCALGMEGISEPAPNVKLGRLLDAASNASLWSRESLDLTAVDNE